MGIVRTKSPKSRPNLLTPISNISRYYCAYTLKSLIINITCKSEDGSGNVDSCRNSGSLSMKQMHTSLERGRGDDCKCLHGTKLQCNLKPELTKCNVEKHFASREEKFEDGSDSFTSKDILESKDGSDSFSKDGLEKSGKQTADGDSKDVLESLKLQGNCKSEDGSDYFTSKDRLESLNLQGNLKPVPQEEKFRMKYWRTCKYFSKIHQFGSERCPAFRKVCRNCLSKNHFASVCWNKKKKMRKCSSLSNCKTSVEKSSSDYSEKDNITEVRGISTRIQKEVEKNVAIKSDNSEEDDKVYSETDMTDKYEKIETLVEKQCGAAYQSSSGKYDKDSKQYQGHGSTDGLGKESLKCWKMIAGGNDQQVAGDIKTENLHQLKVNSKISKRMPWKEEIAIQQAFSKLSQEERETHYHQCKDEGCVKCLLKGLYKVLQHAVMESKPIGCRL